MTLVDCSFEKQHRACLEITKNSEVAQRAQIKWTGEEVWTTKETTDSMTIGHM